MIIGVLSDTHGFISIAEKALARMGDIDILLHAGDLATDAIHFQNRGYEVYCVAGNCDNYKSEPTERIVEIQGKKIFLTHGHTYRVKYGYEKLLAKAKEILADIVVFGHTHVPQNTYIDNVLFFNPGSIVLPRGGCPGTYGVLEIIDGHINARISTL